MVERRTLIALGLSVAAITYAALGAALPAHVLDGKALQQPTGAVTATANLIAQSR